MSTTHDQILTHCIEENCIWFTYYYICKEHNVTALSRAEYILELHSRNQLPA